MTNSSQFGKALEILYDMELDRVFMSRGIEELKKKAATYGKKRNIYKPIKKKSTEDGSECIFFGLAGGVILGALSGVIYGFIIEHGFFDRINAMFKHGIIFGIIGLVLGLIFGVILAKAVVRGEEEDISAAYEKDMKEYERQIKADDKRVALEMEEREFVLTQKEELDERLYNTSRMLTQFYNKLGIDRDFQNVIAVGYMYEFWRIGISRKLEGADGLYYLVRKEIKNDIMHMKIDEILRKLDQILDNQSAIYSKLTAINRKCDSMVKASVASLEYAAKNNKMAAKAVQNTELAAYNSERIAAELRYQNFIKTYLMV